MLAINILLLSLLHVFVASSPYPAPASADATSSKLAGKRSQAVQLYAALATSPSNMTAVGACLKTTPGVRYGVVPYCLIQEDVKTQNFTFEDHTYELNHPAKVNGSTPKHPKYEEYSWGKLLNSSGLPAWKGEPSPPWDPNFNGAKSANSYWSIDATTRVLSEWMTNPPTANATKDSTFYLCEYSGIARKIQELYSPKMWESFSNGGMTWSCKKAVVKAIVIGSLH